MEGPRNYDDKDLAIAGIIILAIVVCVALMIAGSDPSHLAGMAITAVAALATGRKGSP